MKFRSWYTKNGLRLSLAMGFLAAPVACLDRVACAQEIEVYVTLGKSEQPHRIDSEEIKLEPIGPKDTAPVVTALAASNSGSVLAVAGDDHFIRIIDVASGETRQTLAGHTDWIQALVFSTDGKHLYSSGNDGKILQWEQADRSEPVQIAQLPYAIRSLSIASEKGLLAFGGFSDEIIVWDLQANSVQHRLLCDCRDQRCVRFSPDGTQLLCGGRDGEVRVWDVASGELKADFHAHRRRVHTAAFSADGTRVTSVGEDRKLIQYDLASKTVLLERELAQSKLMSMCLINDGMVAVAGADNSVHLYDVANDEVVAHLKGHYGTVAVMAPCGERLVSGSFDTTVRIWNLQSIETSAVSSGIPVSAPLKMDSSLRIR